MLDLMNHDNPLRIKNLVNNAIVANAQFVEPSKVRRKWFWPQVIQIGCKPVDSLTNSMTNRFI